MTLLQKITQAQLNIQNPKRDAKGQVGKRIYPYATLNSCMDVVNEACQPLGLVVWFDLKYWEGRKTVTADSMVDTMLDTLVAVETVISDGTGVERRSPIKVNLDGGSQDNGSAITYAKRYSLCAAFGISPEEDDDDGKRSQRAYAERNRVPRNQVPHHGKQSNVQSAPNPRNEALTEFTPILAKWCDQYQVGIEEQKEHIKKRDDFEDTADFYRKIAEEYKADLNG